MYIKYYILCFLIELGPLGSHLEKDQIVFTPHTKPNSVWIKNVLEEYISNPFMILAWGRHLTDLKFTGYKTNYKFKCMFHLKKPST